MITDAQNRPSNSQSLAGAAATTVSTDSIDMLTANRNPGRSGQLRAVVHVMTAFTGGTAVYAQLISSANANLSSPTVLATGATVADAAALAGAELLDVPLPDSAQRYLGFQYVTTGTHTTGAVSAHIVGGSDRPASDITMNTGL
jgi:hypothetical protein